MSRDTSRGKATVRQLCQAMAITRQAYYAARERMKRPPAPARPAKPRPGNWTPASELEAGIRAVVAAHPAWGVRKVWATLRRKGLRAGRKRVWAMMRALGLVLPPAVKREANRSGGTVAVPTSNRRWASDLTTVWTKRDGVCAVLPVIDCGDRYLLQCEATRSQEAPDVLLPIERSLFTTFGTPARVPHGLELLTDHGPQYTGRDAVAVCERWNVLHIFSPVARPTGNAIAERVILTLKVELVWARDWESLDELREAIAEWMKQYNEERPHEALGWQTPAERRAANLTEANTLQQKAAA